MKLNRSELRFCCSRKSDESRRSVPRSFLLKAKSWENSQVSSTDFSILNFPIPVTSKILFKIRRFWILENSEDLHFSVQCISCQELTWTSNFPLTQRWFSRIVYRKRTFNARFRINTESSLRKTAKNSNIWKNVLFTIYCNLLLIHFSAWKVQVKS